MAHENDPVALVLWVMWLNTCLVFGANYIGYIDMIYHAYM